MVSAEYENHWKAIGEIAIWYEANSGSRNEATTRVQLIDRILFESLAWDRSDVIAEESHDGQYADYTLNAPRRLLIVEAKKEGTYFELPVGLDGIQYSIPTLLRTTSALRAAMEQVAGYCQSRGVPYAAVTNGHQFVIFVATRSDGVPPFKGAAVVFSSLAQMRDRFMDFWNTLSKPAIERQMLRARLYDQIGPTLPPKPCALIAPYPGTKGRNPFQSSMKAVSEFILEDAPKARTIEQTFLKACYCHSGALSSYSLASKEMLRTRYAALFDSDRPGPSLQPAAEWGETNPELLAQSFSRRPILLIGDVGAGKTTFIRNLISDDPENFSEKALALYIDLGSTGAMTRDLRSYIVEEIDRQLLMDHSLDIRSDDLVRDIYSEDLRRFGSGINKDLRQRKPTLYKEKEIALLEQLLQNREEHVRMALSLLSARLRRQLIIFLDNSDQRSEQDQQTTFLIAQEMAERWQTVVYLTLRPETYHASMERGALTGYHPKAFTRRPAAHRSRDQETALFWAQGHWWGSEGRRYQLDYRIRRHFPQNPDEGVSAHLTHEKGYPSLHRKCGRGQCPPCS
jgi:GTPase SAR1 family protein